MLEVCCVLLLRRPISGCIRYINTLSTEDWAVTTIVDPVACLFRMPGDRHRRRWSRLCRPGCYAPLPDLTSREGTGALETHRRYPGPERDRPERPGRKRCPGGHRNGDDTLLPVLPLAPADVTGVPDRSGREFSSSAPPGNAGHAVTQRLHRIVAILATAGASGAILLSSTCRRISHFTTGTAPGGTQVRTVRHRNASTPSGPTAPFGHARVQAPHPVQSGAPLGPALFPVF